MTPNLLTLPTVTVGGKTYAVKYSHGAIYLLSTWGIDISRIFQTLADALGCDAVEATDTAPARPAVIPNGHRTELLTKIAAAGLGTIDAEGRWRSAQITPMDLSERMSDDEVDLVDRVTWEAFAKKIGLQLPTKPEAAAAPIQPDTTKTSGSDSGPSEPAQPE
jgi:hypothetical protein